MMKYFISKENNSDSIRQGDIFSIGNKCHSNFMEEEEFAMVITADCDIAQNKMGKYFTLLPIISIERYLETRWLPRVFESELKSIVKANVEKFNLAKKADGYEFDPIDSKGMQNWLGIESLDSIFNSMNIKVDRNVISDSEKVKVLRGEPSFSSFYNLRMSLQKRKKDKVDFEVKQVAKQLREEYFFIPEIPILSGMGAIIKLRDVRSLNNELVYSSEFDAKISVNSKEEGITRIGEFSDFLRFSIAQKFAMLFSRIGMPEYFESDVDESLGLLSKDLSEVHNEY